MDPLPELPETGDDRFFTKDALDFQYTTGPAENNPLFPTWGSTGAEMAAIGAAAAANAMTPATAASPSTSPTPPSSPPPPATAGSVPAVAVAAAARSPSIASPRATRRGGGGKKRALPTPPPEPAHTSPSGRSSRGRGVTPTAAAAVAVPSTTADRTVFLRERLGGESVSSGNSSTSAGSGSDNGSASDDIAGEWEGGAGTGAAKENGNGKRNRRGVARRAKKPFMRSGAAAAAANAPPASSAAAAATAPSALGASASQAPTKAAIRTRYGGSSSKSNRRHRKSKSRGGGGGRGGASDGSSSSLAGSGSTTSSVSSRSSHGGGGGGGRSRSSSISIDAGAYASWDSLVKPFKQQWDHVEGPPAAVAVAAATAWSASVGGSKLPSSPLASGGVCSVFSAESRPNNTTAFSVEQCSAQAHPMAVASYVLRVRCAGGAHIVRRTWDDIVSLCSMLNRDTASSAGAASAEGSVGADKEAAAAGTAGTAAAAVEFTPADVLARDAASAFLKDILSRLGMASSIPVRRFLELEYLDGTLRGGLVDHSRANAARQVACLAALTTAAAAAASAAQGSFAVGDNTNEAVAATATAAADAVAPGGTETPATTSSGGDSGDLESSFDGEQQPPSVVVPRPAQSLPAHPDAARDLAAVCRCLGELGASAFTPAPSSSSVPAAFRGAAPYWSVVGEEAGGSGGGGDGGGGGARVALHRGVALLA